MSKTVKDLTIQFERFAEITITARDLSERDQDYTDHHQWSDKELRELNVRGQPPVVINRIKNKVNILKGIQRIARTKPRALPRTPEHEEGADALTEGLRFVSDNNNFEVLSSAVFESEIVSGYGGAIVEFDERGDIKINEIPWDRYYFDPHSRMLDFSDKTYDGIVIWMDKSEAKELWPDSVEDIDGAFDSTGSGSPDRTFDDKPQWINPERNRLRICQHFYKDDGWKMATFTANFFLDEPEDSPFLDEFGEPTDPIEAQTAYIDRHLDRYSEVRAYIWLQDEINKRRSKLLYAISVNQTIGEDGAVDNIDEMKREAAKPDGHIKVNRGFEFSFRDNSQENQTQFLLYKESKEEIDQIGANPFLSGRGVAASGRQDQIQQQSGKVELASLYDGHKAWEKRIYRQIANRIKQSWTAEKWVRITDDRKTLEWVGFNLEITAGMLLQEKAEQGDQDALQVLQQLTGDPRLNEIVEVRNNPSELDVDILISESPNLVTLRQEQFQTLADIAERSAGQGVVIPFEAMLELSEIPNKDDIIKLIQPDPIQQAAQVELQSQAAQLEIKAKEADIQVKEAKAAKDFADAEAQQVETQLVKAGFNLEDLEADSRKKRADAVLKEEEAFQKRVETEAILKDPEVQVVAQI